MKITVGKGECLCYCSGNRKKLNLEKIEPVRPVKLDWYLLCEDSRNAVPGTMHPRKESSEQEQIMKSKIVVIGRNQTKEECGEEHKEIVCPFSEMWESKSLVKR